MSKKPPAKSNDTRKLGRGLIAVTFGSGGSVSKRTNEKTDDNQKSERGLIAVTLGSGGSISASQTVTESSRPNRSSKKKS